MGCWGITAFESDEGLDAVEFIRESIPEDGKLELETLVETLKRDSWNAPPEVETAGSHTSVYFLLSSCRLIGNLASLNTDSFAKSLCKYSL